jgi:hypothetical protein
MVLVSGHLVRLYRKESLKTIASKKGLAAMHWPPFVRWENLPAHETSLAGALVLGGWVEREESSAEVLVQVVEALM